MIIIGYPKNREVIGVTSRATTGTAAEKEAAAAGKTKAAEAHGILEDNRGTADSKTSPGARSPPSAAFSFYEDFVDLGKTASFPTEDCQNDSNKCCKT